MGRRKRIAVGLAVLLAAGAVGALETPDPGPFYRGDCGGFLARGVKAQNELAGERLVRIDAVLGAGIEKHLERNGAFVFQAFQILGVKIGAAIETDELTPEHLDFGIVGNHGRPLCCCTVQHV